MTRAPEGAFHRAPRPLIGWVTVVLILSCTVFVCAVLAAIALGFWLTAGKGQGVPDMTGGLAVLITALVPAWGVAAQWLHTRSREKRDEIAFGGQAAPPFAPAPPSTPPDDVSGPRPGENHQ